MTVFITISRLLYKVLGVLIALYLTVALCYMFLYRFHEYSLGGAGLFQKGLVVLSQPIIDVLGNSKISRADSFVIDSSLYNRVKNKLVTADTHDTTDYSSTWNRYTSQASTAVIRPAQYTGEWKLGYCVQQICMLSQLVTTHAQALQKSGAVQVFGIDTSGSVLDLGNVFYQYPAKLGSVLLQ